MRLSLTRGRYHVRLAETDEDVRAAQRLRRRIFIEERSAPGADGDADALDVDAFDAVCDHMLIEERKSGALVCCFRLMPLESAADIDKSYSAQFYDLSALREIEGPIVEMGRFCIDPAHRNGDVLRTAWAAMAQHVEDRGFELLFGCSSFEGNDETPYEDTFALLRDQHLAPSRFSPRPKATNVFQFAKRLRIGKPDPRRALRMMPPLLRGYLSLGGWVSDFAVIDRELNTLHVFTGVEVKRVPESRVRALKQA